MIRFIRLHFVEISLFGYGNWCTFTVVVHHFVFVNLITTTTRRDLTITVTWQLLCTHLPTYTHTICINISWHFESTQLIPNFGFQFYLQYMAIT